jgi:hypothetical protein
MIFNVTIIIVLGRHEPRPYKTANLIDNVACVPTVPPTGCSPVSLPHLGPPYSLRHNIEIRPINNPTMARKCSIERKSRTFLTLNQKLHMIMFSEEGM